MKVCYFVNNDIVRIDKILEYGDDYEFEKIKSLDFFKNTLSKDLITLFYQNDLKGHVEAWQHAVDGNYDILALTNEYILNDDFNINYYKNLLKTHDLLYNEKSDFYITNKKSCEKLLKSFNGGSLIETFNEIKDLKKDILTGV